VIALAILDAVPIGEALARADARFAAAESAGRVSASHSRALEH